MPLGFGDYVLLQPELLNAYAQAVLRTLRDDPYERGAIAEERVLRGDLTYPVDFERLSEGDERIVLHAMHKQLVERAICLRDSDPAGKRPTMLVFPSYFRRERPDRPTQPQFYMTFRFSGFLDEIYAVLVVRLHHTEPFESCDLWHNAADFRTVGGHQIGVRLIALGDGSGEIGVYCDREVPLSEQVIFAKYVDEHLSRNAFDVKRLRTYLCPKCSTPVENRDAAHARLMEGKVDIICAYCERRIPLWDDIEQKLGSKAIRGRVEAMQRAAGVVLDSESRERLLVGDVVSTVARANQISRELSVSDHGIDMELEFKDDDGKATGRKLYLQLKSGDSYLQRSGRGGQRVFRIRKPRHADYWADQQFPVMLVIRDSEGGIEWMEIGRILRTQRSAAALGGGEWPAKAISFQGDQFDVMAIREWRDRVLLQRS